MIIASASSVIAGLYFLKKNKYGLYIVPFVLALPLATFLLSLILMLDATFVAFTDNYPIWNFVIPLAVSFVGSTLYLLVFLKALSPKMRKEFNLDEDTIKEEYIAGNCKPLLYLLAISCILVLIPYLALIPFLLNLLGFYVKPIDVKPLLYTLYYGEYSESLENSLKYASGAFELIMTFVAVITLPVVFKFRRRLELLAWFVAFGLLFLELPAILVLFSPLWRLVYYLMFTALVFHSGRGRLLGLLKII